MLFSQEAKRGRGRPPRKRSSGAAEGGTAPKTAREAEPGPRSPEPESVEANEPSFSFKRKSFVHSALLDGDKVKRYGFKTLKQIVQLELSQASKAAQGSLFSQIAAPPRAGPELKVSDVSGLPTSYQDPRTRLRFASREEFALIRTMPQEIIAAYLRLRGVPTYSVGT